MNRKHGCPSILNYDVLMWPSGQGHHSRKQVGDTQRQSLLPEQAEMWATPNAMAGGSVSRGGDRIEELLLGGQATNWATPQHADGEAGGGANQACLTNQVEGRYSHQAPAIKVGPASSKRTRTSRRRLNPMFTEFLMGWMPGWTIPEPISCDAWVTELSRFRQQLRLSLSLTGLEFLNERTPEKKGE